MTTNGRWRRRNATERRRGHDQRDSGGVEEEAEEWRRIEKRPGHLLHLLLLLLHLESEFHSFHGNSCLETPQREEQLRGKSTVIAPDTI